MATKSSSKLKNGVPAEIMYGDTARVRRIRRFLRNNRRALRETVNSRLPVLSDPLEFAEIYLEALRTQMLHIQGDYRSANAPSTTLFKHCKYDPKAASPTLDASSPSRPVEWKPSSPPSAKKSAPRPRPARPASTYRAAERVSGGCGSFVFREIEIPEP